MIFYLFLVIFILIIVKIYDLSKQNKYLKNELMKYKSDDFNLETVVKTEIKKETKVLNKKERIEIIKNKEIKDRENKNIAILITGAILIIMSAIVFLMSTWNVINDIFKTFVLILLVFVFMGASKVAKEKFNLKKASITFFYIGMAYIPISLLSISILGLFGDYLSITGNGNFIYLTISGIITAVLYYVIYKKNNNTNLFYGSLLAQVITIVLFSCIFEINIGLIAIDLLLYNLLMMLITKNHEQFNILKKLYYVIPYIALSLLILDTIQINIFVPLSYLFIAINLYLIDLKKDQKITGFFFTLALDLICVYFIDMNSELLTTDGIICISAINTIVIYLLIMIMEKIVKKKNFFLGSALFSFLMINILSLTSLNCENIIVKPWIFSIISLVILVLNYNKVSSRVKIILNKLIPIYFIIAGLNLLFVAKATYHSFLIFAILGFTLTQFLKGDLKKNSFIFSHILMFIVYLFNFVLNHTEMNYIMFYYIVLLVIYSYSYFTTRCKIYKYMGYISSHILLNSICVLLGIGYEVSYLLPMIVIIGIMNLENKNKSLKDNFSQPFLSCYKIIAYFAICNIYTLLGVVATILFSGYFLYDNRKNNNKLAIIPLIGLTSVIFNDPGLDRNIISIIMLIITAGTTLLSFESKKINIYTIFSGIYLFLMFLIMNIYYINELLFTLWAFTNYYILTPDKEKDIFKFLTGVGIANFYGIVINEIGLDAYTAFSFLGIIILFITVLRTILNKYVKKVDVLEAIIFGVINLAALNNYSNELDGMIYMILLCGIIMLSYIKKYGMLFCVTLITIVVNVILLTREFWLSIPWWIYLLLIGSILVTFAVKNEVDDKNSITNTIKNFKDKIDK